MIYYIALAFIDIGYFLWGHWKELTFTAAASGIGVILGKRIGVKFAVNYITKSIGLYQRPLSELQMEHHENEIVKLGGQPWTVPTSRPYRINIRRILFKRSMWSRMARSIARFTKLRMNLRRVSRMNLSGKKKILTIGVAILINGCNDVFGLGLSQGTITTVSALGGGYVLVEAIIDIVRAWSNRTKEVVVTNAEFKTPVESTD